MTVTNELAAGPPLTQPRRHAAHKRAEEIRLGFQSTAVLYAKAVTEQDWRVLGYAGVAAWASGEFGPDRFSAERRKEIVALLTTAGHTVREIEAATGAGHATVLRDQRGARGPAGPEGSERPRSPYLSDDVPATPRQHAARDREARRAAEREELAERERSRELTERGLIELSRDQGTETGPERPQGLTGGSGAAGEPRALPPSPGQEPAARPRLASARQRQLGAAEIEEIITGDLTRGQIVARFGVGEHAAQLARVTAVAVREERARYAAVVACVCSCGRCGPLSAHDCGSRACGQPARPAVPAAAAPEPFPTGPRQRLTEARAALESLCIRDYGPDDASLRQVMDLYDDLVALGEWQRRQLADIQKYLSDLDGRKRIAKLRRVAGRTPEEAATALALAARLERKLAGPAP